MALNYLVSRTNIMTSIFFSSYQQGFADFRKSL